MTLRTRLAVLLAALMAVFVVGAGVMSAWLANSTLRDRVDNDMVELADEFGERLDRAGDPRNDRFDLALLGGVERRRGQPGAALPRGPLDEAAIQFQIVLPDGRFLGSDIPIENAVVARVVADGEDRFRTTTIDGRRFRVLTRVDGAVTLQFATEIESLESGLTSLGRGLVVAGTVGVVLAGLLGWFAAGRFTRPITDVTAAAQALARNEVLPEPIVSDRTDEVGQLATSFNELVSALEMSREQQRRLVADASHELRTPLTSLRMKIDFLHKEPTMAADQREQVLAGAAVELEALTALVNELVELAANSAEDEEPEVVDLAELVTEVARRVELSTGRPVAVTAAPHRSVVRPAMVRRAVSNLLDNAHKYSPATAPVEIRQSGDRIEVVDHGPGIAPRDRSRAFDRFFRSSSAQPRPGSGIGLAIVKHCADSHGGEVWIDETPGGGATVGFSVADRRTPGSGAGG